MTAGDIRPNARGGRAARRANKIELEADFQKARGVLSDDQMKHEQAWAEKLNCPICRQAVHPTNWSAHMALKHADKIIPLHEADPGRLPLTAIRIDGGTQARAYINGSVVEDYAEAMQGGADFPAIIVFFDGATYWLADGFHRVGAALKADLTDIKAEVRQGTQRDAILFSVGTNGTHGLRRTGDDKRRAVIRLLDDSEWAQWSNREIARRCMVSEGLVRSLRTERSDSNKIRTYQTKHGTTATMNTGNIGKSSPPVQYGKIEDDYQPDVPEVQVDHDPVGSEPVKPEETWEEAKLKPNDNGRYSENEIEWKLGGRGATVKLINSGMMGTLAFAVGRMVYIDTINGRRQYYADNVQAVKDQPVVPPAAEKGLTIPVTEAARAQLEADDIIPTVTDEQIEQAQEANIKTIIYGSDYKRDSKTTRQADAAKSQPFDYCLTPPYALDPLLPYMGWSLPSTIWEPACGEGLLVEGLYDAGWTEEHVIGTDILTGQNFFDFQPTQKWEVIVTNPPFSLKFEWLERCYALGKPFALLLPVEVLGTVTAQELMQKHGFEIMLLDSRVDFKMPNAGWEGAGAQFPVLWLCHDLLPEKVMFGSIKAAKKAFKAEIGVEVDDDPE